MKNSMLSILSVLGLLTSAAVAAPPTTSTTEPIKAVYHVNEPDKVWTALRNIQNHLRDDPSVRVVLVANGGGIDFLLKEATDKQGTPFQPTLTELVDKGVTFKVCRNTLTARKLTDDAVAEKVVVIQAAVAEIARLQQREGYAYLKP
jgi:uncharacterized protein